MDYCNTKLDFLRSAQKIKENKTVTHINLFRQLDTPLSRHYVNAATETSHFISINPDSPKKGN